MIQYINKVPSKIEYYEMLSSEYDDVDVSNISNELDSSVASVCVYNGDRLVGMGRIKKEQDNLCIEDLIVKLEPYKEEIQNNIIVSLINQVNQIKLYDATIRDCLEVS